MAITSSVASMVSQKVYVGVLTKLSPNFSLMAINLRSNGVSTRTSEDIRAIGSFIYYVSNGLGGLGRFNKWQVLLKPFLRKRLRFWWAFLFNFGPIVFR